MKHQSKWRVLAPDETKEFLAGIKEEGAQTDVERLRNALRRVARFSHAKDFSHHGVEFEECDKSSCVEARAELGR